MIHCKTVHQNIFSLQVRGTSCKNGHLALIYADLAFFSLVSRQQDEPFEKEIHWIMFYDNHCQSQSTDIRLN